MYVIISDISVQSIVTSTGVMAARFVFYDLYLSKSRRVLARVGTRSARDNTLRQLLGTYRT